MYVEGHEHDDLPPLVVREVPQNQLRVLVQHLRSGLGVWFRFGVSYFVFRFGVWSLGLGFRV